MYSDKRGTWTGYPFLFNHKLTEDNMFIKKGENKYAYVNADPKDSLVKNMTAGVYNVNVHRNPFTGTSYTFDGIDAFDNGKVIESGIYKTARKKVYDFISPEMKEARTMLGLKHKLGLVFNGKPGTGKTFLAGQLASEMAVKKDAIGFVITEELNLANFVDMIREQEPDRMIILILDEFEKTHDIHHGQIDSNLLGFLDGAKSRNNVITIATVNSTNKLPNVLMERPGRFEDIYEFSIKDDDVLKGMVQGIIPDEMVDKISVEEMVTLMKKHNVYAMDRLTVLVRDKIYELITKEKAEAEKPKESKEKKA